MSKRKQICSLSHPMLLSLQHNLPFPNKSLERANYVMLALRLPVKYRDGGKATAPIQEEAFLNTKRPMASWDLHA